MSHFHYNAILPELGTTSIYGAKLPAKRLVTATDIISGSGSGSSVFTLIGKTATIMPQLALKKPSLASFLVNLQKTTEEEIQIALEDTGHYCFNILRFLRNQGYPTFSYNPLLIKEFAKHHSLRKTKTDKKDAMTIARKLREDIDKQLFKVQTNMVELKYATRNVSRIKENCTRQKVSYTRLLDILFPELASFLGAPAAKHKAYIYAILREFPSASQLANAHLTKLTNLISIHSRGRFGKEQALVFKKN